MKEAPNNFTSIPSEIRFDKGICANAKLLFGEISALCNETGYCWAKNAHFAKLYNVSTVSISKWINKLAEKGYIKNEIVKNNEGTSRKIYLCGVKDKFARVQTEVCTGINESLDGYKEKFKHNNTFNNKSNNTINIDKEKIEKEIFVDVEKVEIEKITKPVEAKKIKKEKSKEILFVESEVAEFSVFEKCFENTDYANFDLNFYFESVKNWSISKGAKKIDWIATTRGFILRDIQAGKPKMKQNVELIQNPNGIFKNASSAHTQNGAFKAHNYSDKRHDNFDLQKANELAREINSHTRGFREMLATELRGKRKFGSGN